MNFTFLKYFSESPSAIGSSDSQEFKDAVLAAVSSMGSPVASGPHNLIAMFSATGTIPACSAGDIRPLQVKINLTKARPLILAPVCEKSAIPTVNGSNASREIVRGDFDFVSSFGFPADARGKFETPSIGQVLLTAYLQPIVRDSVTSPWRKSGARFLWAVDTSPQAAYSVAASPDNPLPTSGMRMLGSASVVLSQMTSHSEWMEKYQSVPDAAVPDSLAAFTLDDLWITTPIQAKASYAGGGSVTSHHRWYIHSRNVPTDCNMMIGPDFSTGSVTMDSNNPSLAFTLPLSL